MSDTKTDALQRAVADTPMDAATVESVLIGGDLSRLNPKQRLAYYQAVCKSIGLNPLTKPFDYINLKGKLVLYAKRDAADQLRNLNNISIDKPEIRFEDDWIIVTVVAKDEKGRVDSDIGVVHRKEMQGEFGNALMKAVTKAKRRVTLSICGLGWLDETEVADIPEAELVNGETLPSTDPLADVDEELRASIEKGFSLLKLTSGQIQSKMNEYFGGVPSEDWPSRAAKLYDHLKDEYAKLEGRPRVSKPDNGKTARGATSPTADSGSTSPAPPAPRPPTGRRAEPAAEAPHTSPAGDFF